MYTIRDWKNGKILCRLKADSLQNSSLQGRDLSWANLERKNLSGANLRGVKLSHAKLQYSIFKNTDLEGADIRGANLLRSYFYKSNLSSCNLSRAILSGATLNETDLSYAKFYRTTLGNTNFISCDSLNLISRIDTIRHRNPSSIDVITLKKCIDKLPIKFLEGIGFNQEQIDNLKKLNGVDSMQHYSCFISHSKVDNKFASKLYKDLRANNISCWIYSHDMQGGKEWEEQIVEAIKSYDKLILVCSRNSIYSKNVVMEILNAIDNERHDNVRKLFPIRLDDHILEKKMMDEAREKVKSGEWRENWVYYITKIHIPDFSQWKDDNIYETALYKLIEDLSTSKINM